MITPIDGMQHFLFCDLGSPSSYRLKHRGADCGLPIAAKFLRVLLSDDEPVGFGKIVGKAECDDRLDRVIRNCNGTSVILRDLPELIKIYLYRP